MKRPVAEFLTVMVQSGAESQHMQCEHEAWQILRRKQGYVTHRTYQQCGNPLQRLVYSEWESAKALDGALQHLHGTPLMRRVRATLSAPPQRRLVDLVGPITSTKGLDLSERAVAAGAITRLDTDAGRWRTQEEGLWKLLASQPGYLTHVLLRGVNDPLSVGSWSHWEDQDAFERALRQLDGALAEGAAAPFAKVATYTVYARLGD